MVAKIVTAQNSQVEFTKYPLEPSECVEENTKSNISHVKNEQLPKISILFVAVLFFPLFFSFFFVILVRKNLDRNNS